MISVQAVTKSYGSTRALDGLSFEVLAGRVTGFLGPNGAGKSTAMRVIVGLDAADSGRALVNGKRYRDLLWPLREVGTHLDAKDFHPGRSAETHLVALAQANDIDRARVATVLDLVGLTSAARRRAGTFSLGLAQRLSIAAALLGDPGTLLFDEPVNGLDPDGVRWFRRLVAGLADEGRSVLLSSHLISEMALTADHLVVIGQGRLVAELSMAELMARAPRFVTVRTPEPEQLTAAVRERGMTITVRPDGSLVVAGAEADEIARRAAAAGIPLYELSPQRASLEDVYMELTHGNLEFEAEGSQGLGSKVVMHTNPGGSS